MNAMANKTSMKTAKVAKKSTAARTAANPTNSRKTPPRSSLSASRKPAKPWKTLAGDYPPMTKTYGDEAVQAYFATIRDWKLDVVRRLDALITRLVPGVRKAVRGESPFYGVRGQGWFLNYHCFIKYVKITFYRGTSLRPAPLGKSRHPEARYFDIYKDEKFDQPLIASWVKQASELPGVRM
jgi:hypothetical protein